MKNFLYMAAVALLGSTAFAQSNNGEMMISKLILPNGKELKSGQMDSLRNVWGQDRIIFRHSGKDDEKGIVYLIRKTDEQLQQEEAANSALNSMVGKAAPQFELTDLQGKKWSIKALRGKVIVLNFWFTACPPCIHEMPELNRLTEQYKSKDVIFLALANDKAGKINAFLQKKDFKYRIIPNSYEVSKSFKVTSWPTSMVIDKNGNISFIQVTGEDINTRLTAAINKAL